MITKNGSLFSTTDDGPWKLRNHPKDDSNFHQKYSGKWFRQNGYVIAVLPDSIEMDGTTIKIDVRPEMEHGTFSVFRDGKQIVPEAVN